MKPIKQMFVFHLRTFVVALVVAVLLSTRFGNVFTFAPGQEPDFEAMFKDFDFNSFVQDLEKELAAIEEKSPGALDKSFDAIAQKPSESFAKQATKSSATGTAEIVSNPNDEDISDDPEELITNPPIITVKRNNKDTKIPHKKADAAFCSYVEDIMHALDDIDRIATGINNEEFREYYLAGMGNALVETEVAMAEMLDKKAYRVAVLAPPKEVAKIFDDYRKNIIKTRAQLMKLAKDLQISEKEELNDEAKAQASLASLLEMSAMEPATLTPLLPISSKKTIRKAPKDPTPTSFDDDSYNLPAPASSQNQYPIDDGGYNPLTAPGSQTPTDEEFAEFMNLTGSKPIPWQQQPTEPLEDVS